jgi:hypothetical protein
LRCSGAFPYDLHRGDLTLLWFHGTRRSGVEDYLGILRSGCHPAPFKNDTQQLEMDLQISPPRVYCYLGRTLEQFGEFCMVFDPRRLPVGEMSPFDTGGLVRKIPPVRDWPESDRAAYLAALSFSTADREAHVAAYPADRRPGYLDCERPPQEGPHEIWPNSPVAEIWKQGTHWRAWTWEGRWALLPVSGNLRAWTCSPSLFMDILEAIEGCDDIPTSAVDEFLACFRPGGVGALIADLRAEQTS